MTDPKEIPNGSHPKRKMATFIASSPVTSASKPISMTRSLSSRTPCRPADIPSKLWDQPAIKKLQVATGALFIPSHLCEWGLAPADQPAKRYKKGQWNLVSPGLYAYALLIARPCQHQHEHVPVKGSSTNGNYPRTREAQVYPPALCKAWALVHTAAYKGWGSRPILTRLTKLADQQQLTQWGGQEGNGPDGRTYTQAIEAITQRRKQEGNRAPNRDGVVGGGGDEGEARGVSMMR